MRDTSRRMYAVHSALGAGVGLVLYAVMFTGAPALFEHELLAWEHPELRFEIPDRVALDAAVARGLAEIPPRTDDIFVFFPEASRPSVRLQWVRDHESRWLDVHPQTLEPLADAQYGFTRVWRQIHTNALMGRLGRYAVGLAGLAMLLMLVSGLFAHRKMLQQLFTWRRERSFRVSLGDLHKLLGVWGSLVYLMFAFTGAILGLLGVLTLVSALVAYGGDQEAAVEAVLGPAVEPVGVLQGPPRLAPLIEKASARHPNIEWTSARLMHWRDANAHIELGGERTDAIAMNTAVRYRARDGVQVYEVDWVERGIWHRLFGLIMPLHYGTFGGLALKVLYAVLGIIGSIVVATGLILWLEARRKRRATSISFRRIHAVTLGLIGGFPLATLALPTIDRLVAQHSTARIDVLITAYVFLLLVSIVVAFQRPSGAALRDSLLASGAFSLATPVSDTMLSGWSAAWTPGPAAAANVAFVGVALLCISGARLLPVEALALPLRPNSSLNTLPQRT